MKPIPLTFRLGGCNKDLGYVDVARGPWVVSWVWINDMGEPTAEFLVLESYFLKDLLTPRLPESS